METSNLDAELLSQLEESKFLRLFRYLIDEVHESGSDAYDDNLTKCSFPLDLPDTELHSKVVGSDRDRYNTALFTWLFQVVHLPQFLWHEDFASKFLYERLKRACLNLKARPDILNAARSPQWSRSADTIWDPIHKGYNYYIFTNLNHGFDEPSLEKFSDMAHDIFDEVLNLPREEHPKFGIGTPELFVRKSKDDVHNFIVDLLNIPSNYYLVAREGKISVIPTTEHGAYLASNSNIQTKSELIGLSTVISSSLTETRLQLPGLSDFEDLLNNSRAKEADFQSFLEENKQFLFALDDRYCEIKPHVCLFDAKRERLVPDFMARIQDTNIWDVIELKRPQHVLTVSSCLTQKASAPAARAIAELLQYRDFFSTRDNRALVANKFATSPYEPCLVLVIGRGRPTERYEWRSTRAGFPSVEIVSYDYLFQRARDCKRVITQ